MNDPRHTEYLVRARLDLLGMSTRQQELWMGSKVPGLAGWTPRELIWGGRGHAVVDLVDDLVRSTARANRA